MCKDEFKPVGDIIKAVEGICDEKVVVITGGAGLLGKMHAEAIKDAGGKVILTDVVSDDECVYMDITDKKSIENFVDGLDRFSFGIKSHIKYDTSCKSVFNMLCCSGGSRVDINLIASGSLLE